MITEYRPMAKLPEAAGYKAGDVLLVFGELFGRGYANGIVDEARRLGMTIVGTTVGRRDSDGALRCLNDDELAAAEAILGGRIINVPLEAGFDVEQVDGASSISEQLKSVKTDDWETAAFSDEYLKRCIAAGRDRFCKNLRQVVGEFEKLVPAGANVLVSHVMAGGFPRARIFMMLLNRVFKGTGDRYLPSKKLWESGIGRMCAASFDEVTAETFRLLLQETAGLRNQIARCGGRINYTAYGYHGTGVLVGGEYCWQSYTPYMPGWAKLKLEEIAAEASRNGICATVFNCPEIQTNSSVLFLGVEIPLYRLLASIRQKLGDKSAPLFERCQAMLAQGKGIDALLHKAEAYLATPMLKNIWEFGSWPHHNTKEQAELMLATSAELMEMHADQNNLVCAELSRIVFRSTGRLIVHASWTPEAPVVWLDHRIITELLATANAHESIILS